MPNVVLLRDSIIDNRAYVRPDEPDVVAQLADLLPDGWRATLLAIDGSVTSDVARQLAHLPADASHIVISSGGNDALGHIDILGSAARSAADVLARLADMAEVFARDYHAMIQAVTAAGLPVVACTIYEGSFPDPTLQRLAATALMVFNDAIVREAARARIPLIDLRTVCREPADYANPIEPSAIGGAKVARAIARIVQAHDFTMRVTTLHTDDDAMPSQRA